MNGADSFNFKQALDAPTEVYRSPEDVLSDPRLDTEGKRAILKNWAELERENSVAQEEGMQPEQENILPRVTTALSRLEGGGARGWPSARERPTPMTPVSHFMVETDTFVHAEHAATEAETRMARSREDLLPVVDGDEIVGIVRSDDLNAEPESPEASRPLSVADIMWTDFAFCYEDDTLDTAVRIANDTEQEILLVLDHSDFLIGLIHIPAIRDEIAAKSDGGEGKQDWRQRRRTYSSRHAAEGDDLDVKNYASAPRIKR